MDSASITIQANTNYEIGFLYNLQSLYSNAETIPSLEDKVDLNLINPFTPNSIVLSNDLAEVRYILFLKWN